MSDKPGDSKLSAAEAARAKAEEMRKAQERKSRNRNVIVASIVAVAVLALVAVAFVLIRNSSPEKLEASPEGTPKNVSEGAIAFGDDDAPVTADIYFDYMCPWCGDFEKKYGPTFEELAESGDLKVNYRPLGFLDTLSRGTMFSTRAAGASYCVANESPEKWWDFNQLMFENQPAEQTNGLRNSQIAEIAEEAGVPSDIEGCIDADQFEDYVGEYTEKASEAGINSTPTFTLDGDVVDLATLQSPEDLIAAVEKAKDGEEAGATDESDANDGDDAGADDSEDAATEEEDAPAAE